MCASHVESKRTLGLQLFGKRFFQFVSWLCGPRPLHGRVEGGEKEQKGIKARGPSEGAPQLQRARESELVTQNKRIREGGGPSESEPGLQRARYNETSDVTMGSDVAMGTLDCEFDVCEVFSQSCFCREANERGMVGGYSLNSVKSNPV